MTTISLIIPDMLTPYSQMTVVDSIMFAGGTVTNILPTLAEIELQGYLSKEDIVKAIEQVGYEVQES